MVTFTGRLATACCVSFLRSLVYITLALERLVSWCTPDLERESTRTKREDGRMYTPPSVGGGGGGGHIIWENRGSSHYYAAVGGFENGSHREHMCRRPGLKYLTLSKHRCSY